MTGVRNRNDCLGLRPWRTKRRWQDENRCWGICPSQFPQQGDVRAAPENRTGWTAFCQALPMLEAAPHGQHGVAEASPQKLDEFSTVLGNICGDLAKAIREKP